jgi:fumarate hydratase class II
VHGNDMTIGFAASQGNFELNVFKPVIIYNFLQSVRLLADAMRSFNDNCARGITANREVIERYVRDSLMLVTALNPHIGYDNAAKIAKLAYKENITLKQAAVKLGLLTAEQFDRYVVPAEMTHPTSHKLQVTSYKS